MNERNKNAIKQLVKEVNMSMKSDNFDPNGSYTGVVDYDEMPIQDQDDL